MESQDSSHNHNHNHNQQQQQPPFPTVFPSQIPNNNSNFNNSNSMIPHQQNLNQNPFNSIIQQQHNHNHHFNNTDEVHTSASLGLGIEPARKKRGRPRKYSPDNTNSNTNTNTIALGLSPGDNNNNILLNEPGGSDNSGKRNRGRPPGSVKKQLDALGLPGVGFTPHVILVNKGEDIASKIVAFSQQGPRTVCILSANGAVSNVTLRQTAMSGGTVTYELITANGAVSNFTLRQTAMSGGTVTYELITANGAVSNFTLRQTAMSGGTVTYEGRFEIISLSGSFMLVESNGNRSRSGSLSVSLAGSDGRVLGGGVAGTLKAATPVQVIVGSFIADGKRPKALRLLSSPPPSSMMDFSAPVTKTSPSLDGSSESGGESDESPPNHGTGPYNSNSVQPHQNMQPPMYSNVGWPNSMKME